MYKFLPILVLVVILVSYLYLPIRREIAYGLHISGDPTTSCCNIKDIIANKGDFDESANVAFFDGQEVDYPKTSLASAASVVNASSNVLGTTNSNGEEKWIDVNLTTETLTAYEGNKVYMQFPISSGRWGPTPVGTFTIWAKTRYQAMVGGSKELGTYYNLPNVPDNMFFYQGYALHGAYWHNNFGHPMSHGCVNEPLAQAHQIFEWAGPVVPEGKNAVLATPDNPGTRVYIHT